METDRPTANKASKNPEAASLELPLVKIVGVSAAGKSTLVTGLRQLGYNARTAVQEHSEVPDMWRRIRPPDWLIFLDVDLPAQRARRPDVSWSEAWRRTELQRLEHARNQADLIINTSCLSSESILRQVVRFLHMHSVQAAPAPLAHCSVSKLQSVDIYRFSCYKD